MQIDKSIKEAQKYILNYFIDNHTTSLEYKDLYDALAKDYSLYVIHESIHQLHERNIIALDKVDQKVMLEDYIYVVQHALNLKRKISAKILLYLIISNRPFILKNEEVSFNYIDLLASISLRITYVRNKFMIYNGMYELISKDYVKRINSKFFILLYRHINANLLEFCFSLETQKGYMFL